MHIICPWRWCDKLASIGGENHVATTTKRRQGSETQRNESQTSAPYKSTRSTTPKYLDLRTDDKAPQQRPATLKNSIRAGDTPIPQEFNMVAPIKFMAENNPKYLKFGLNLDRVSSQPKDRRSPSKIRISATRGLPKSDDLTFLGRRNSAKRLQTNSTKFTLTSREPLVLPGNRSTTSSAKAKAWTRTSGKAVGRSKSRLFI